MSNISGRIGAKSTTSEAKEGIAEDSDDEKVSNTFQDSGNTGGGSEGDFDVSVREAVMNHKKKGIFLTGVPQASLGEEVDVRVAREDDLVFEMGDIQLGPKLGQRKGPNERRGLLMQYPNIMILKPNF